MSDVKVVNQALALIQGAGITSLELPANRVAAVANAFFDDARDMVLESANWWFAMKIDTLAIDADDTHEAAVWAGNAYELPADCIRPVELNPGDEATKDWRGYERQPVTPPPSPPPAPFSRAGDPGKWTPPAPAVSFSHL